MYTLSDRARRQAIASLSIVWLVSASSAAESTDDAPPTVPSGFGGGEGFSLHDAADRLQIRLGDQRIATFLKRHPKLTRRALVNVMTPSGVQVTRNFPPRLPEDRTLGRRDGSADHALMHPGIWIGFGDVDGNDYWRLKAKVVHEGIVGKPSASKDEARFATRNRYLSEDGKRTVCIETSRYRFLRRTEGVYIVVEAEFRSDERDFYFGDQEESGLAIRVESKLRVEGGRGAIRNDHGDENGRAVWGKEAAWVDYSGVVDGRRVGLMAIPSPRNPRRSWMHSRDYGVVVVNPFPRQPRERREPYVKTQVKKGEPYRLSWIVLVHDLPADRSIDHDAAYREALRLLKVDAKAAKPN